MYLYSPFSIYIFKCGLHYFSAKVRSDISICPLATSSNQPNPWNREPGTPCPTLCDQCVGSLTTHRAMNIEVLWDGAYGLSSLSEKTRKSNHLQMSLSSQFFKDPECWSSRSLNPRPLARHPRRPRGSQSEAGEMARRKFSRTGGRTPGYQISPDHFQTASRIPAPDWAE